MKRYLVLLRGINVGGKNKVPMAELRSLLERLGYEDVRTYIASGNALVSTTRSAGAVAEQIEEALPQHFDLHSDVVRVRVLTHAQLRRVVTERPPGFGERPQTYDSDAIFLIGITTQAAMRVFSPREGVDTIWPGPGVIYSQRLSSERTKSRLGRIVGTPEYKSMTIRSWQTTTKLLELMEQPK